jgi:uncharacterized membrane protein YsdA (DUF1294 family)
MTSKRRTTTSFNYNYYTIALSIGATATVGACLVLLLRTSWSTFTIWMTSINMTTLLLFAMDKMASKMTNKIVRYRIPEMVLHVFTIMGGVLGQRLGRAMFHHKSNIRRHPSFQRVQYASLVLWACLIYWYYYKGASR